MRLRARPTACCSIIGHSGGCEWVARYLEGLEHDAVVDTNSMPMYTTRSRRVKTDKRDARVLAEAAASVSTALHTAPPTGSARSARNSPYARR